MTSLPHILLLVTDQFRYDAFSPILTPNLYDLATTTTESGNLARPTFFSNAYTSTPTCTPARAALLTGKGPWNHGMLGYSNAVNCEEYATTLPFVLKDLLGYQTAMVGKNHFGTKPIKNTDSNNNNNSIDDPPRRKFIDHGYQSLDLYDGLTEIPDDYDQFFQKILPGEDPLATCHMGWNDWTACPYKFEEYLHPTSWTTREALKVIDETLGTPNNSTSSINNSPLFLKVSYHRPHSPYDPPKRLWDKHQQRAKTNSTDPNYERNIGKDSSSWDKEYFRDFMDKPDAWQGDPGRELALTSRAAYLANVEFVDEGIGQILERFRQHGQEENTFVVWVTDHGDMNGDHNLWRKGYPWEASSHINMVMKLPNAFTTEPTATPLRNQRKGTSTSTVSDAIVEIRDVAPTIYDLLEILENVTEADPLINGRSLLPILQRRSESVRDHLDLEHSTVNDFRIHWNALVGSLPKNNTAANNHSCTRYKYIFFAGTDTEQLFCLSEDPLELEDLAPSKPYETVLSAWRTTLVEQFLREGRGDHWVSQDGTLPIRTEGTTIGPNYPCQESTSNWQQVTRPAWNKIEMRSKSFIEQQLIDSSHAVLEQATNGRIDIGTLATEKPVSGPGKDSPSNKLQTDYDFNTSLGQMAQCGFEIRIVFVITTLFLTLLLRYCYFHKGKTLQRNSKTK